MYTLGGWKETFKNVFSPSTTWDLGSNSGHQAAQEPLPTEPSHRPLVVTINSAPLIGLLGTIDQTWLTRAAQGPGSDATTNSYLRWGTESVPHKPLQQTALPTWS